MKYELLAEIGFSDLGDRQRRGVSHVVRVDGQSGRELARRDRRVLLDVPAQSLFSWSNVPLQDMTDLVVD